MAVKRSSCSNTTKPCVSLTRQTCQHMVNAAKETYNCSCYNFNMNVECSQPQCSSLSVDHSTPPASGSSQQMVCPAEPPDLQVPQWNHRPDNRYSVCTVELGFVHILAKCSIKRALIVCIADNKCCRIF